MLKRRVVYNLIKFLRLKGAPEKLALGFAVGACMNFFPTFGFGIPLAGLAAAAVLANIPSGLLGDIIFKPLFPALFYANLATGYFLWTNRIGDVHHLWKMLLHPTLSNLAIAGKIFITGALINSFAFGLILYILIYLIMKRYRLPILKWLIVKNRRKHN